MKNQTSRSTLWTKLGIILIITFILLFPVGQLKSLINERSNYGKQARNEVSSKWSNKQILGSIQLTVPAVRTIKSKDEKGKSITEKENINIFFLPEDLKITANTKNIIKSRGIYEVPLYESQVEMKGHFENLSTKEIDGLDHTLILWEKAILSIGVSDARGINSVKVKWNKKPINIKMGSMPSGLFSSSLNSKIGLENKKLKSKKEFFIELNIKGSRNLSFVPFGKTTIVEMSSNWGNPSFMGGFLPEKHEVFK